MGCWCDLDIAYFDATENVCRPCHERCVGCSAGDIESCLDCDSSLGYYWQPADDVFGVLADLGLTRHINDWAFLVPPYPVPGNKPCLYSFDKTLPHLTKEPDLDDTCGNGETLFEECDVGVGIVDGAIGTPVPDQYNAC